MYVVICMYKKQLIIKKKKKAENLTVLMGGLKSPPSISFCNSPFHISAAINSFLPICPIPAGSEPDFSMSFLGRSLKLLGQIFI